MSFKISVQQLGKRFNREWIFRDLTYTFESGNIYAITGPNGSGKSTLLQILWGQLPPSSGSIHYFSGDRQVEIGDLHKHISIATPYMDLIDEFTLEEQLHFHFKIKSTYNGLSIDQVLDILNLRKARNKHIAKFSSGMKQRLKSALAFLTQTAVIFLDEPSTNLDSQGFEWYWELLRNTTAGRLVIIASNQPSEYPPNALKIDIMSHK